MKSKFVGTLKTAGLYTARFMFVTSPVLSLTAVVAKAGFKPAQNLIAGTVEDAIVAASQTVLDIVAEIEAAENPARLRN